MYSQAAYKPNINFMYGSGSFVGTEETQPFIFYNPMTTAQRDAIKYFANDTATVIYNSDLDTLQYSVDQGSSWYSFGSGSIISASTSVAGKSELGTLADILAGTYIGDSGSPLVASLQSFVITSTGSLSAGSPVATNTAGYLDIEVGGTGTGWILSGALLIGQGNEALHTLIPTSNGDVVTVSGSSFVSKAVNATQTLVASIAQGTNMDGAAFGTGAKFSLSGSTIQVGDVFTIFADVSSNGGGRQTKVTFGGVDTAIFDNNTATVRCKIVVRAIGVSGTYAASCTSESFNPLAIRNSGSLLRTFDSTQTSLDVSIEGRQYSGSENAHNVEMFEITKSRPLSTALTPP